MSIRRFDAGLAKERNPIRQKAGSRTMAPMSGATNNPAATGSERTSLGSLESFAERLEHLCCDSTLIHELDQMACKGV